MPGLGIRVGKHVRVLGLLRARRTCESGTAQAIVSPGAAKSHLAISGRFFRATVRHPTGRSLFSVVVFVTLRTRRSRGGAGLHGRRSFDAARSVDGRL